MTFKKCICIILSAVILLCFTGCEDNEKGNNSSSGELINSSEYDDTLNLLYNSSDTFNPYTVQTDLNRQLCKLIYEPLVKTDNEYNPVFRLAKSVDIEKNVCTVKLITAYFSDGAKVTATDVVDSFNVAKGSSTYYASKLACAESAEASNAETVVFTMTKQNPYFANLLDFPIIKSGTEALTDSDGVEIPPIACGRYYVSEDKTSLIINDRFFGDESSIKKIKLTNAPDMSSITHYVEVGAADIYYSDVADDSIVRMSAVKYDINLNNLVYIGINERYGQLSDRNLKYAISSALGRQQICTSSYYNNAIAATGFFNPLWDEVKSVQNLQTSSDSEITVENLEKIGYNNLNEDGLRVNESGNALQFTLLVNSENSMRVAAAKQIASQLKQYGIGITVIEQSYNQYLQSLKSGSFQLYLAEIAVTPDMDLSQLVLPGGSAAYGIPGSAPISAEDTEGEESTDTQEAEQAEQTEQAGQVNPSTCADVIVGFYNGVNTITDVANILQADMPVIPVCYRTGILFCNEKIENIEEMSLCDIYFSIEKYKIKK